MKKGTYGGGTFGVPFFGGFGGGLYIDNHGRVYPQLYRGTPGGSLSVGYSSDLEGLLTGPSISWSPGVGSVRFNVGTSQSASGFGIGTPGGGVTHGFGPLEMSHDFSRPWATPYLRDSAAAAEIPSRYNVWEYDYPESASPNASSASASVAKTHTPQQIADLLVRYGHVRPATRSQEELSPFERRLQSGLATVGQPSEWPIRFLSSPRPARRQHGRLDRQPPWRQHGCDGCWHQRAQPKYARDERQPIAGSDIHHGGGSCSVSSCCGTEQARRPSRLDRFGPR
jgi:hypothetical protein